MCYENVHCYDPSSPVPATIPCGLNAHKSIQPYSKLFLKDKIIEMLDMPPFAEEEFVAYLILDSLKLYPYLSGIFSKS